MMMVWILGTLFWWGLAFYPTSAQTPDWLNVARSVCFGAPEHGLPDSAGWMVLTLGPLSFLLAGVLAWPQELRSTLVSLRYSRPGRGLFVLVLAAVLVEAFWVAKKVEMAARYESLSFENLSQDDLPDTYPRTRKPAHDFLLIDQSGQSFRLADYRNETILLTFAFAHCESVCPVLVRQVLETGSAFKQGVRVVVLTLDPWRDTPKSLPSLAKHWGFKEKTHLLSGAVEDVTATLKAFEVPFQRDERTGDVTHPALVYVIAPDGTIAFTFNNAPERWLKQAVERIASEDDQTLSAAR